MGNCLKDRHKEDFKKGKNNKHLRVYQKQYCNG